MNQLMHERMEGLESDPELLKDRRVAYKEFENLTMPLFKYGKSLRFDVSSLDLESINPERKELLVEAPENVKIMKPSDAKDLFMKKAFFYGENKLSALHAAFWTGGCVIEIPESTEVLEPIRITDEVEGTSITHVVVVVGKNSKAQITDVSKGKGFKSHVVEAFLTEGSTLSYETMQDMEEGSWHFAVKRAILSKNSRIDWFTATMGSGISREETSTDLAGEGSSSSNHGIFLGKKNQGFDIYNTAVHNAPNTTSDMDSKGIVKDKSKSIYRGLIKINEGARNSEGYQKQDTLMLSDEAEADAVPNLEIDNNEVKCSHGATMGRIDEEKIFYMTSRGMMRKEAEDEIVKGFLESMVDRVKNEELKNKIRENVVQRLDG